MSVVTKIENNPFVRISLPVILGIVGARCFPIDSTVLWILFGIIYSAAWVTRGTPVANMYVIASLMLCPAAIFSSTTTTYSLPEQQPLYMCLQVTDTPHVVGRWQRATANIGYYRNAGEAHSYDDERSECPSSSKSLRPANDRGGLESLPNWTAVDQRVILNVDTCYRIALGEQFACRGYVNRFDRSEQHRDYAALMEARGFVGTLYVTPRNLICKSPSTINTPLIYAKRLQNYAVAQIDKLRLTGDEYAIAKTMIAGTRHGMDRQLSQAYSRIGAAHLLAVSGLHVGIVFAFLNILLYLLPLLPKGHIARNLIVIVAIWIYAAMTGLSPSVIRAAMMFSGAQIALASTHYRDAVNIMLGTAVVMLCLNPNNLFDISFQLSFIAVFFILLIYPPLYRAMRGRSKAINVGASLVLIGLVASAATIPLVSYKFGNIPIMGIVIGPLLVICSNFILTLSIGWIMMPLPIARELVGTVLNWLIGAQNTMVEWGASFQFSAVEYRMSWWTVGVCYLLLGTVAIWIWSRDKKETLTLDYDDNK